MERINVKTHETFKIKQKGDKIGNLDFDVLGKRHVLAVDGARPDELGHPRSVAIDQPDPARRQSITPHKALGEVQQMCVCGHGQELLAGHAGGGAGGLLGVAHLSRVLPRQRLLRLRLLI